MDDIMDISLIIPCHNLGWYIKPLLLSFDSLYLNGINAEFIFVLDDCTDETETLIKAYMEHIDNVKILHCNYHRCGLARNDGLEVARGEYIWFVDGDDWITYPYAVRDMISIMRENNLNILQLKFISNFFDKDYFSMVWQYVFRKDFIGDLRFIDVQPDEDVAFMREIFKDMTEVECYNIPTYFYNYLRPGSVITQVLDNQLKENEKIDE